MSREHILIGVEGNHDQAFLVKVMCKLLGFSKCEELSNLEPIWKKFIPKYPPSKTGKLYIRLDMPSILYTETLSVAIYAGGGSELIKNLTNKLADMDYNNELSAFAIIADADKDNPAEVARKYHQGFREYFPDFPRVVAATGTIQENRPRVGLYILPNNVDQGVLDTLLCDCGKIAYPEYMNRAKAYIQQFSEEEISQIVWKPFDKEKATIAAVASILKPGKTNTATISDDRWISEQTSTQIPSLQNLLTFLKQLLKMESI